MNLSEKKNENFDGYWYTKSGKLIPMGEGEEHLEYVLVHPEVFGLSREIIKDFEKQNGRINVYDPEANLDFLDVILKRGNLRIRFFNDPDIIDGVYCQFTYYRDTKNIGNCLIDYEDEFRGWPLFFVDMANNGLGEEFPNIEKALQWCYK